MKENKRERAKREERIMRRIDEEKYCDDDGDGIANGM